MAFIRFSRSYDAQADTVIETVQSPMTGPKAIAIEKQESEYLPENPTFGCKAAIAGRSSLPEGAL